VDCPTDLDCAAEEECPPEDVASPVLDYLARDYDALRTRLLDRVSALVPGWDDRHPADVGVMLVELFAHLGDRLASWQDAVALEAYLGTARRRASVRRHARLLDYRVHDGCAARVYLALTTTTEVDLPAGSPVTDTATDLRPVEAARGGAVVVETVAGARLRPARNALPLYAWGDPAHCLPAGATSAFLRAPHGGAGPGLRRGDVLVLAATAPGDGTGGGTDGDALAAGGDPTRRFAVRLDRDPVEHRDDVVGADVLEIHWHPEDALAAPLVVTEPGPDGGPAVRAVALANVVLADHGASVAAEDLLETGREETRLLARGPLAFAEPAALELAGAAVLRSASALLRPEARAAVAQLTLDDGRRTWEPRPDLLASDRAAAHVVAETEADRTWLRFGDGTVGRRPSPGAPLRAWYRVGGGARGNVAADRLVHLVDPPSGADLAVTNPLPAQGGTEPQALEEVRQLAPQEFRRQQRAVTSADYAAVAAADPGVQRAVARRRWTGSWYSQEVTVDPVAARAADPALGAALAGVLDARRTAVTDVAVTDPVYVPLHVVLAGCLLPGYHPAHVRGELTRRLSARVLPDGRRGFFHPDHFTFGQPLLLSDLVAAAMEVTGLAWVEVTRLARAGASEEESAVAIAAGRLRLGPREVLQCDSDPGDPEAGRVELELGGGS
jgi:hypothetical protein